MGDCCCCDSKEEPASKNLARKSVCCTDLAFLIFFIASWAGMIYVAMFALEQGDVYRFIYGYDSFGNTCGMDNSDKPVANVSNSGMNNEEKKYVFFMNIFDPDYSMEICVSQCPEQFLFTPNDVWDFFNSTGSKLCEYSVDPDNYLDASFYNAEGDGPCPNLPIFPSIPVLYRCVPNPAILIDFLNNTEVLAEVRTILEEQTSLVRKVVSDFYLAWKEILFLCLVAVALSLVLLLIMKYFAAIIVYVTIISSSLSLVVATGVLWWTWIDLRSDRMKAEEQFDLPLINVDINNETAFLSFSIGLSLFTILIFVLIVVLYKRLQLVIAIFGEAGKCVLAIPFLLLTPLITLPLLLAFAAAWAVTFGFINTLDKGVPSYEKSYVEVVYEPMWQRDYFFWYYIVLGIWTIEFLMAAEQFVIISAVAMWYFNRNPPSTPCNCVVCQGLSRLILHHIGTIAFGSFIVTLVKLPRYSLMYVHATLEHTSSEVAKCAIRCVLCCVWLLEKILKFLNKNAYIITAIEAKSFCPASKRAFAILVSNALRVATLNSVGAFVFFLGKIAVVASTAAIGVLWFRRIDNLYFYAIPVVVVSVFCYFVAHNFLSVYETICDCLLLCFCIDCELNDGSPGREYYMSTGLMGFVEQSSHELDVIDGRRARPLHAIAEKETTSSEIGETEIKSQVASKVDLPATSVSHASPEKTTPTATSPFPQSPSPRTITPVQTRSSMSKRPSKASPVKSMSRSISPFHNSPSPRTITPVQTRSSMSKRSSKVSPVRSTPRTISPFHNSMSRKTMTPAQTPLSKSRPTSN